MIVDMLRARVSGIGQGQWGSERGLLIGGAIDDAAFDRRSDQRH